MIKFVSLFAFFALIIFQSTVNANAISERRRVALICRNETYVDDSVFEAIVNNDYASVDPSVPKNMCFSRCLCNKMGFCTVNGDYDRNNIVGLLSTDKAKELTGYMDQCKDETGVDACQTAFRKSRCFFAKVDENTGFFNKIGNFFSGVFG